MSQLPEPQASRPHMPEYGIPETAEGMLSWSWAVERLQAPRNYWLSTTRPDTRPHVMPIWCVWINNAFYFSTGAQSLKARNLAANSHCVISVEHGEGSVMVEGTAHSIATESVPPEAFTAYKAKYAWELDPQTGPIYRMQPRVLFGFSNVPGEYAGSATRWKF